MKPLRRKKTYEVTYDPITGKDRTLELTQEENVLSDQGSVDSESLTRKYFRDCGCDGQVGGECNKCGAISCTSCHGRCHRCKKPICLEHSYFLQVEGEDAIRFCHRHYIMHCWKNAILFFLSLVGRFFLSLLVEEENDE